MVGQMYQGDRIGQMNEALSSREGPIMRAMERLGILSDRLSKAVHELEERLPVVLQPDHPREERNGIAAPTSPETPLSEAIQIKCGEIEGCERRLQVLIRRLGL